MNPKKELLWGLWANPQPPGPKPAESPVQGPPLGAQMSSHGTPYHRLATGLHGLIRNPLKAIQGF